MLQERIAAHYMQLGWESVPGTTVGEGPTAFRPDVLLHKGGRMMAVKADEGRLGTYAIGVFGAQCRRAKMRGLVVCESAPEVIEACETAGLDFADLEEVGRPIVLKKVLAPPPEPVVAAQPVALGPVEEPTMEFEEIRRVPMWRWAIVAAIWAAAITVSVYWLTLVT